jgi:hypothetical protein
MKNLLLIAIIITSTLTSCDIQKKRYSRGFTISKNRNYNHLVKKEKEKKTNSYSEMQKITAPIISKLNQEPIITSIIIKDKLELSEENNNQLTIGISENPEKVNKKLITNKYKVIKNHISKHRITKKHLVNSQINKTQITNKIDAVTIGLLLLKLILAVGLAILALFILYSGLNEILIIVLLSIIFIAFLALTYS